MPTRSYSLHPVYMTLLAGFLLFLTDAFIDELAGTPEWIPSGHIGGMTLWYILFYTWYKTMTAAYRVDLNNTEGTLRVHRLLGRRIIKFGEIIDVTSTDLLVRIITTRGIVSVSNLIDGVSSIDTVLRPHIPERSETEKEELSRHSVSRKEIILRGLIHAVLLLLAVYFQLRRSGWRQG